MGLYKTLSRPTVSLSGNLENKRTPNLLQFRQGTQTNGQFSRLPRRKINVLLMAKDFFFFFKLYQYWNSERKSRVFFEKKKTPKTPTVEVWNILCDVSWQDTWAVFNTQIIAERIGWFKRTEKGKYWMICHLCWSRME